jgi:hypothetical protein
MMKSIKSISAALSLITNHVPFSYVYPAHHTMAVTNHPLSRLQSSVRDPFHKFPEEVAHPLLIPPIKVPHRDRKD